jgi:ParB-like chromosome segregation protein Spo0J
MQQQIALSKLVFDPALYPRQNLNQSNVADLVRAMEGGIHLPPIVVAAGSFKICDGVHRFHAAAKTGAKKISAEVKKYRNNAEMFKDAVLLNSATGLKLDTHDKLKIIEVGSHLGLKEIDLAAILRTSEQYIKSLRPMYAKVSGSAQRVGLKHPVRHLSGTEITQEQKEAMERAPGQSYLLTVRQLLDAIRFDLLPPKAKHPKLWEELSALRDALDPIV